MRRFLRHILLIGILIAGLSMLLDYAYTRAFYNDTPRNKVQLAAQLENENIDFIFLGSSRVENHIDCDIVRKLTGKSCLNLGFQGGRIKDYRVLASILKENNITFEKLLLQVDYSYNFDNYSPIFLAQLAPFITRDNFPEYLKKDLPRSFNNGIPFLRYASNEKMIGIREVTSQFLKREIAFDLSNGFSPLEGSGKSVSGHFPDQLKYPNEALENITNLFSEKVILFTAPYCKIAVNRDSFMQSLVTMYPNVYNFIDIFDTQERYLYDCGHLNAQGAEKFTEILTNEILIN